MYQTKFKWLKSIGLLTVFITSLAFLKPSQQVPSWIAPATAKNLKNPIVPDATNLADAKKLYLKECNSCHGKKGEGDGPSSATVGRDLTPLGNASIQNQTDGELFWKISEGKKPMPTTKKSLSEQQRWLLVNYIRTFKKIGK